jgi:type II secretory pathway pseudopilin PulG
MQRKNYFLNSFKSYKNGMAMIMALVVIVVLGTIMALSLSMTALTTKRTTDLYLYEQSILLAKSATEYQLLQIAQNLPCTDLDVTFPHDTIYTIDIKTLYVYENLTSTDPCDDTNGTSYTNVITPEQNGSALIDVSVSVLDGNVSSEPIRYFRRTLQKL